MPQENKRFLVIDGSSLAHRAFYALPLLTNRQGVYTNAAYGFLTMLFKILEEEPVDYIAVAFDKSRITFRNERYPDYKGHRKATPQELRPQFDLIKELLAALRIASFEMDNFEADDLIGTLAKEADNQGMDVMILTGDRDALQLISPRTKVLLTRKGISQLETYDEKKIQEEFGVNPEQLIDVKGLMGDSSDNIPGVPGIGEKTALRLIKQYAALGNVLDNIEELSGPKLRENLKTYEEQALLSKDLATIRRDVPMEFSLDNCRYRKPDYPSLLRHYKELEFKSLIPGVLEEMGLEQEPGEEETTAIEVKKLETVEELAQTMECLSPHGILSLALELDKPDSWQGNLLALGLATEKNAYGYELQSGELEEVMALLGKLFSTPQHQWILHDAKQTMVFGGRFNLPLFKLHGDTMVGAYLLNPSKGQPSLATISLEYLNIPLVEQENPGQRAGERAAILHRLHEELLNQLSKGEMESLYRDLELPLVSILASMERHGVKLDLSLLEEMGDELAGHIQGLTEEIYQLAGEEFNINSPKQLGGILFDKLGLPPLKRTKTGYSTNAEVLEELAPRHPIVANILAYRQLVKLHGTYVEGLQALAHPNTGKVHTTFNQTVTATGRLSSQEPNLQNIPIRLEQGRLIRKAFIPAKKGSLILAADYSQIELRVLAHISEDPNLTDAFTKGQDIHRRTASEVFGLPMDAVDQDMRHKAKAVNFGIVYGISDYGLSRDLGITRKEAGQYIDLYFARYPGVKTYMDQIVLEAKEQGYVKTLLNRRRYLPDLFSSNRNIRSFGERTAINTPIQGSAADIIKLAMIRVIDLIEERGLKTEMVLQVHDELIFEVPEEELTQAAKLIKDAMENAISLNVPLVVDIKVGENWYDLE